MICCSVFIYHHEHFPAGLILFSSIYIMAFRYWNTFCAMCKCEYLELQSLIIPLGILDIGKDPQISKKEIQLPTSK